ncbi:MAG: ribosome biogenesis GTPase YlqF [Erysipelotrichaceae bacterium]|nr:ribosome biogenesis GTPase YlqF [Erysipelotrichaceae bacterium]MDD3923594.1 ribosome biogenesis GTPase YlqF [Erysipelotrichaceae bacterium]MDD4642302.1 ribosome biogenesis GTPase YlqF [Erysipelotrichaceae bacterium]
MSIQWFPGHMAKASKEMQEKMKAVDMIIELRDARVPNASHNPILDQIAGNKPRLIVLTKKDKADAYQTDKWLEYLNTAYKALAFDLNKDRLNDRITNACLELMQMKHEKQRNRGINPRAIRAMVVGIPNVGKSTFINRLSKRRVAQTADKPGVTRALKLVVVNKYLELIDTPGVLWPKFDDQKIGLYLGLTGAISDNVLPITQIALFGLNHLLENYPLRIQERYGIKVTEDIEDVIAQIANKRGYISNKGFDRQKTLNLLIKEIRDDQFSGITWERYDETIM